MEKIGKTALDEMFAAVNQKEPKRENPRRVFSEDEVLNFDRLLAHAWYLREKGEPERVDIVRAEVKFYVGCGQQYASVALYDSEMLLSGDSQNRNHFLIFEKFHEDWLPELQLTEDERREYVAEYGDRHDEEIPDVPPRVSRLLQSVLRAKDLADRYRLDYECFPMPGYEYHPTANDAATRRDWRGFVFVLRPLAFHAPHFGVRG